MVDQGSAGINKVPRGRYLNIKSSCVLLAIINASTGEIITVQNSNDFNAEFGYYTDENESLLNKEAEQKFQQLSRQVAKIAKSGKRDVSRLKVDPDIVYKFFAYQL